MAGMRHKARGYVQTLSGDQMKLTDGITVPVPERILPEIRKALLEELV
jgi:hypothetical protein